MVDLGTALHLALSDDATLESMITGESSLGCAERPGWVDELWSLVADTARRVGVRI
ncbi:MAG: hypothetical protein QM736_00610 [Vicinamibacterales bacterium]